MSFIVVIPARFASTRLPGKPLVDIAGKPMVQWVYERSLQAGADKVIVATDDQRVFDAVTAFGGEVMMTRADHQSGTERLAEVIEHLQLDDDAVVVNVQGDEPLIPPANITQVAENLMTNGAPMATLSVDIHDVDEALNPNAVKVVCDKQGFALYFSRSTIPYDRERFMTTSTIDEIGPYYHRHVGIYAYRAGFIRRYITWPASELEQVEALEQLRVLWNGERIHVARAHVNPPAGVDTQEDLDVVRRIVSGQDSRYRYDSDESDIGTILGD